MTATHFVRSHRIPLFVSDSVKGLGAAFVTTPISTYLHEQTHALAFHLLYENANPTIKLNDYGFAGGYCRPNFSGQRRLSKVGRFFGRNGSSAIVSAAGPAMELAIDIAFQKLFPGNLVSNGFVFLKSMQIAAYAISALENSSEFLSPKNAQMISHDYLNVRRKVGMLAGTVMVSIPIAHTLHAGVNFFQGVVMDLRRYWY